MQKDLLKIIKHYGINVQQRKLAEEVFELQEAITTHELKNSVSYEIPLTELIDTREHIAEEIADVLNVVEQFMYYYDIDFNKQVLEIKHQKVARQLERIRKETDKG